jgi:hypothetical protein
MPLRPLLLALALLVLAAPSASAADLLSGGIRAAGTFDGSCLSPAAGDGVVRREVVTDANGLVQARLAAAEGDWDVGVFAPDGALVAGSAMRGATELAEGFVRGGRTLVVQACRRSGAAGDAQLSVQNVVLPAAAPGKLALARVQVPTAAAKDLLLSLDLDMSEHGRPGYLDVLLHGDPDRETLVRSGLGFEVLIADVAAADAAAMRAAVGPPDGTMPSGRVQYRRLAEFGEDMKKLVAENPTLVKPVTLPYPTLEGRAVEGVEITENPGAADGKPVFLQLGVHHAREWPSAEMAMEWAFELVNTFKAGNERTVGLLRRARVIVVPVVNPDGFNLSRETIADAGQALVDPGFAYKRKNCRITDGAVPAAGECGLTANRDKGTDPNRNYGGFWGGPGASRSPGSDTYRGAGPFSEPETQNIRALVSTRQVTTLITNHTYSDLVLRPPGFANGPVAPDEALLKSLGDSMAAENGYTSQKGYELYDTTGSTEDWSYFTTGGLGYTFEIGKLDNADGGAVAGAGFHPPYPYGVVAPWFGVNAPGGGNREAYYLALESTADAARHAVITGRGRPGATLRLLKRFSSQTNGGEDGPISFEEGLTSTMTIPPSGAFELHANQSTRPLLVGTRTEAWTLQCEDAAKRVLGSTEVVVARGERKDVGVACSGAEPATAASLPKLTVRATVKRTSLRTLLKRGLPVRVTCSAACNATVRLAKGARTVGRGSRSGMSGPVTLRVKLSPAGRKALRRARRATLRLTVSATGAGGVRAAATKTLKLRR